MRRNIVAFALLGLTGCNHSSRQTVSSERPPTGGAVQDDEQIVRDAFGGALPSLPALAADGNRAALLHVESIALGEAVRWDAWFVPAGDGAPVVMPILAEEEGRQILAEMPIDTGPVAARARAVAEQLRRGGFVAMTEIPDAARAEAIPLGRATLEQDFGATVRLVDGAGTVVASEELDGGELHEVYTDAVGHRVLLVVRFVAASHDEEPPPPRVRLWAVP